MKKTQTFSFTMHIPDVCELVISGVAYCRPDNDWRDKFDWDIDEVEIEVGGIVVDIRDFAIHAYGEEIDEALYPYVVSLFGYNPDEEDMTTDMKQDVPLFGGMRPEIFGRDTDLNPEYGC